MRVNFFEMFQVRDESKFFERFQVRNESKFFWDISGYR